MGSLTSRPKAPTVQQSTVQYVPVSTTASAAQSVSTVSEATATAAEETQNTEEGKTASDQRTSDLLRRSRGRAGTILTGFRGLLESSGSAPARKSLLGE